MEYDYIINKPPLDELYHHGILGQQWGKKNGPPYPLDSKKSTGKRLKISGSIKKKKSPVSKEELSAFRKRMIEQAPTKEESPRGANKGWWKNAPESTIRKYYEQEKKKKNKLSAAGGAVATKAKIATIKSQKKKTDRHERAANASAKDAANLRKHGYIKEAAAVQEVSDKQRAKSKTAKKKNYK